MKPKTTNRVYQIDLFRFLAALSVVFYHYLFRGYIADMSILNFGEIGDFFKYGYLGVDLFFIISGFVILLSIKHNSLLKFIISRITRLYPIYWISLLITFTIIVLFGFPRYTTSIKELLFNLTMFQNYFGVAHVDGVYWSLVVEMKFYIFIVCTYLIINKRKNIKLDNLIYLWLLLTLLYIPFKDLFLFKVAGYFLILNWSSYFISGIIFYQIYSDELRSKYLIPLCICLCISLYHALDKIEIMELTYQTNFSSSIIGGTIISFYLLMLLVSTNNLKFINSPKLIKIGMLTYPLYLIHQNIGFIIFNNLGTNNNKYWLVTGTIITMLLVSYVLSEKYEPKVGFTIKKKLENLTKRYKLN